MIFGVLFTLVASGLFSLSNLLEKRALDVVPSLSVRRPGRMIVALASSRLWVAGFACAGLAVVLMTAGYSLAPVTVIQSIYGIGLVALVLASHLVLGESLARRERVAIGVIIAAAVLVALTLGGSTAPGLGGSTAKVLYTSGGTLLVTAALFALLWRSRGDQSVPFGVTAGLIYGTASLQIKSASVLLDRYGVAHGAVRALASPYPYLFGALSVAGLIVFQVGLQRCRVAVIGPITNIVAAVYVVVAGMALFGEPLPKSAALTAVRFSGFALVLVGTAIYTAGPERPTGGRRAGSATLSAD